MAKQRKTNLDRILQELREGNPWREDNQELIKSAEEAIQRMKERKNESVEEWAQKLANDLGKFTD